MEPIARAEPLKLRVVLLIAALVGVATWDSLRGVCVFIMLVVVELLLTPLLWGLSSILRWLRVRTVVAHRILLLPFLCLCSLSLWWENPYHREKDFLNIIFADQIPSGLKVFDSREGPGWESSTFAAWIRCEPPALKQLLESGEFTREDLSDPAGTNSSRMFPSPAQTQVPRQEWLIYKRSNWPKSGPNHHPSAWIITDPTFSWAFVSIVG